MAKIAQNRPNEKKNIGFGQSGKKFCGHKNFGNFLIKILGMRTKFFRRNSGNTRRYLKSLRLGANVEVQEDLKSVGT